MYRYILVEHIFYSQSKSSPHSLYGINMQIPSAKSVEIIVANYFAIHEFPRSLYNQTNSIVVYQSKTAITKPDLST